MFASAMRAASAAASISCPRMLCANVVGWKPSQNR